MVTNMISQLKELQQFQKVVFYVGICIYKINRTLHCRLGYEFYFLVLKVSLTRSINTRIPVQPCNILYISRE